MFVCCSWGSRLFPFHDLLFLERGVFLVVLLPGDWFWVFSARFFMVAGCSLFVGFSPSFKRVSFWRCALVKL
jgi:hypothetical protein